MKAPCFRYFQVLCLSPTYELALQTGEVASKMSQFAPEITIRYAVRGEEMARGSTIKDHIIIGTPGKVRCCSSLSHAINIIHGSSFFCPRDLFI